MKVRWMVKLPPPPVIGLGDRPHPCGTGRVPIPYIASEGDEQQGRWANTNEASGLGNVACPHISVPLPGLPFFRDFAGLLLTGFFMALTRPRLRRDLWADVFLQGCFGQPANFHGNRPRISTAVVREPLRNARKHSKGVMDGFRQATRCTSSRPYPSRSFAGAWTAHPYISPMPWRWYSQCGTAVRFPQIGCRPLVYRNCPEPARESSVRPWVRRGPFLREASHFPSWPGPPCLPLAFQEAH